MNKPNNSHKHNTPIMKSLGEVKRGKIVRGLKTGHFNDNTLGAYDILKMKEDIIQQIRKHLMSYYAPKSVPMIRQI